MTELSVFRTKTRDNKFKLLPVSVNKHLTDLNLPISQLSKESVPLFRNRPGLLNHASNSSFLNNLAVLPNNRFDRMIKRLKSSKRN
jgi:hypothetical protein